MACERPQSGAVPKEYSMNLDKTLIIVLILVLVIMGPSQLPKLAKMFGKSAKAMKDGLEGKLDEDEDEKPSDKVDAKKNDNPE
jgi:sec-independent protein translocase protein TatA